jgi:Uma2 family endonuclease
MAPPDLLTTRCDLGITIHDLYRLSVAQYHRIADACILDEDTPVELLEGWLVCKYGHFDAWTSRIVGPPDPSPEEEEVGLSLGWIWRFKVKQYRRMIAAGVLTEDDPVELLGGWLIRKMTQKPAHPIAVDLLREALVGRLDRPLYVRTQAPITLAEGEPEPNLALPRGERLEYVDRHPRSSDLWLVAEVADASLARDRGVKQQMYAQAGIPVYWIVNLIERQVEVYSDPARRATPPRYRRRQDYRPGDTLPVILDGVEAGTLAVQELLPP